MDAWAPKIARPGVAVLGFDINLSGVRDSEKQRDIALLEGQIYRFSEILSEQRASTRDNVQRKQARTGEEREESDEEQFTDEESEEDDDDIPYNPKNLPLGWDGKVCVSAYVSICVCVLVRVCVCVHL